MWLIYFFTLLTSEPTGKVLDLHIPTSVNVKRHNFSLKWVKCWIYGRMSLYYINSTFSWKCIHLGLWTDLYGQEVKLFMYFKSFLARATTSKLYWDCIWRFYGILWCILNNFCSLSSIHLTCLRKWVIRYQNSLDVMTG